MDREEQTSINCRTRAIAKRASPGRHVGETEVATTVDCIDEKFLQA